MVELKENFYELLQVDKDANLEEIKAQYKKLARKYHPDINKSKDAEIKFKLLNNAYSVLSDEKRKKEYDSFIKQKVEEKIPDKNSIIKEITISNEEKISGTIRTVNILNTKVCPKCRGKKFILGAKCSFCLGEGKKSEHKKFEIEIPKGIEENELIYAGKINDNAVFPKELFLKIKIAKTQKMILEKGDIIFPLEIPVYDVILGVEKEINVENKGIKKIKIPPLSAPNSRIKLDFEFDNRECYAQIEVIFPKNISNEEKSLYDRIRKINIERENACENKRNFHLHSGRGN